MNEQNKQSSFLDVIDDDTREGILRLNQKLKGLHAEIQAKLQTMDHMQDEESMDKKNHLSNLLGEVDKALLGIDDLFGMVVSDEMSNAEFLKANEDELEKFREMVGENLVRLTKFNEDF